MRVSVNLLGNCVATFVVAKWEGQFDREAMLRAFRGELPQVSESTTAAGAPAAPAAVEPSAAEPAPVR
jgi:aerobic C4-dicarboxylate transport protein